MKKIMIWIIAFLPLLVNAQLSCKDTIEVSADKTVYIVFDDLNKVTSVDIGNGEMANYEDFVPGSVSLVKLKASYHDGFEGETDVLITTKYGIYSFIVKYNPTGETFYKCNIEDAKIIKEKKLSDYNRTEEEENVDQVEEDKDTIIAIASKVFDTKPKFYDSGIISNKKKLSFFATGLYYNSNYIFMKVKVNNKSNLPYDLSYLGVTSKNRKGTIKQSAVQEDFIPPVYIHNYDNKRINGKTSTDYVLVFEKFSISDRKFLYTELWEKNGDRNIAFRIDEKTFLNLELIK